MPAAESARIAAGENSSTLGREPAARSATKKSGTPMGTVIAIAWDIVPVSTPRRALVLFNANVTAASSAKKPPSPRPEPPISMVKVRQGGGAREGGFGARRHCTEGGAVASVSVSEMREQPALPEGRGSSKSNAYRTVRRAKARMSRSALIRATTGSCQEARRRREDARRGQRREIGRASCRER